MLHLIVRNAFSAILLLSISSVTQASVAVSAAIRVVILTPTVDCNSNGTPDDQEPDCNTNSTADECDLNVFAMGTTGNTTVTVIPDLGSAATTLTANQQVFVIDADVRVNIRHTFDADLTMAVSRVGVTVTLASGIGGSGDNFTNTVFDQQAAVAITESAASPPFTGTFRPTQSLDAFNSMQKAGAWTLTVADAVSVNTGTLISWTLTTRQRVTADCNTDGTPDVCQLAGVDCNTNNSLDICEMLVRDCNTNGSLDSCEALADCNTNLTLDICDLLALTGATPSATPNALLRDYRTATSTITPTQNVFVADLNVLVNVRHSAVGQLSMTLSALNRTATLASGIGGAGDDFTGTVFDQQASMPISAAVAPFSGTFQPTGDLDVFNGFPKTTTWTLSMRDGQFGDTGTLLSWTLIARYQPTTDCDSNGVPDACEMTAADCNTNGSLDRCELIRGDCNTDGTLDRCQSLTDCNANFTPDVCELETMASGYKENSSTIWPLADRQVMQLSIFGFLQGTVTDVNVRLDVLHSAISDLEVSLNSSGVMVTLASGVGGLGADFIETVFDQQAATPISGGIAPFTATYRPMQNLNDFNGKSAGAGWELRIFDSVNSNTGTLLAWAIEMTAVTDRDCNTNGTLDVCEGGCNTNGTPDECDVFAPGTAPFVAINANANTPIPDNNSNGQYGRSLFFVQASGVVVDVNLQVNIRHTRDGDLQLSLEKDGNSTLLAYQIGGDGDDYSNTFFDDEADFPIDFGGVPPFSNTYKPYFPLAFLDGVEQHGTWSLTVFDVSSQNTGTILSWGLFITAETSRDCNSDGVPDECNIAFGASADTNADRILDICQDCNTNGTLDPFETGADCDTNLIPDACEGDCNTNATPDPCDALDADCNTNATPDECDIQAFGDCDNNGTPDACEPDCNTDGTRDGCGLPPGDADCDTNLVPDVCDADCNTNHTPDTCDVAMGAADCDANHVPDICDADCNTNSTPDGCESGGDCDSDGLLDICQLRPYVVRLSQTPLGVAGNNWCHDQAISVDGRFVAFYADASNLTPDDSNGFRDVLLVDRAIGSVSNIHHNNSGAAADGPAFVSICISRDGRFVGYVSQAPNLGITTNALQVILYDRQSDQVELISVTPGGVSGNSFSLSPSVSDDGRYVAFESRASDLVPGDTNGLMDIFVRDRITQQTTRLSMSNSGTQSNGGSGAFVDFTNTHFVGSRQVVISEDGRYVAFASHASNLVPGDTNNARDVFVHDRDLGLTTLVSVASDGSAANAASCTLPGGWLGPVGLDMTPDARFVAFSSLATNLVQSDANQRIDLFVRDRWNNKTSIIPLAGTGGQIEVDNPVISNNGRYVAFLSDLNGLVTGQGSGFDNVYRYDRLASRLSLVCRNAAEIGGNSQSGDGEHRCAMSGDGLTVVFPSRATNLTDDAPGPVGGFQMFLAVVDARPDCDVNGRPDACDDDANTNGTPDACECACAGDVNGDHRLDGEDVAAWVRCVLDTPLPADRCACAAGMTTPQFVAVLLQSDPNDCP